MNIREHKVEDFRAVFGAINDLPIRRRTLKNLLIGKKIEKAQAKIYDLIIGYEEVFDAEDDKRSTKQYREVTALKLLRKFLKEELYDEEL
jgi:xanthine dehydrogenase iron-sulfur cluster and FAD-binding subunit A